MNVKDLNEEITIELDNLNTIVNKLLSLRDDITDLPTIHEVTAGEFEKMYL